ncbi:uncharacterized protein KQ657_004497 [Scheffersomyces spartinae]|uniref:Translation initiation factor eIF2B subunit gamma n=1 Tax=Scheffersomyces spartinae TaxID=45513 RepID=A0A9P7VB45_9ASCO|nr:uncharacterized protein KQ657_004497 [Scheffersomyces spartinae]KAG7194816.1 hypothetical protein KQ657_004497 [Scheffersomyces spartinae]
MEFHVVILCGLGKQLTPFSQVRSTGIPKAVLPIANKPMVEYVLRWCELGFFPKVTIVTDSDSEQVIKQALVDHKKWVEEQKQSLTGEQAQPEAESVMDIDILSLNADTSGEVLYHIYKNNIIGAYKHFLLLPCDFVTDLPPQVLIEAYRNREESDIGISVHYRNLLDIEDKKHKIFPIEYTIFLELNDGQCQLLDLYSSADIEFQQALKIRTQMCWRYPNSSISMSLMNSSIFFGSTVEIFNIFDTMQEKSTEQYFASRPISKIVRDLARRSWKHSQPKETIGFMLVPDQATFFRTTNTHVLMEANRYFMKLQAQEKGTSGAQQNKDKLAATVGLDSLVGEGTTLDERTHVKRTVVGNDCVIGKRVKLTGCLLLNNVTIEDDVQLENCIVGHDVRIQTKLKLVHCNVESTHDVVKGTQAKNETLHCLSLEGLIEGDESAIESDSDDDDDDDESSYDEYDGEFDDNDDGLFGY